MKIAEALCVARRLLRELRTLRDRNRERNREIDRQRWRWEWTAYDAGDEALRRLLERPVLGG